MLNRAKAFFSDAPRTNLALGILCIGASPIFVGLAGVSGPVSAFWRLAFAGVFLVPSLWLGKPLRIPAGGWPPLLVGGVCFAADLTLWNQSLTKVPVAVATPVANCAPLWVGIGGWLLWRRRPRIHFWMGFGLALGGMVLLSGATAQAFARNLSGLWLAGAASFFYAGYLLSTSRVRPRMDNLQFMSLSTAVSLAVMLAGCLGSGQDLRVSSWSAWGALAGLGWISHLAGWLLINHALGHLRPEAASVALLGQSVVACLLAIPLLGQWPGMRELAGNALILLGIASAARGSRGPAADE